MSIRRLTVFLSSTGKDLAGYREAVRRHLDRADAFLCDASEAWGARPLSAVPLCRQRVAGCDVFIGLIGHYRGWEPDPAGDPRSITEMEYDWAGEMNKPRLMFVAPESFASGLDLGMSEAEAQRQAAFRQRVLAANDHVHDLQFYQGQFESPGEFAAAVSVALQNELYARMLAAIQASGTSPGPADAASAAAEPAAPDPARALAEFAQDEDLDALLKDPARFDIAKLEAAVAGRAAQRVAEGQRDLAAANEKIKAAARDYKRLAELAYGVDAAKAYHYYALAAETDPTDGMALFWLADTGLATGRTREAMDRLASAIGRLDDSEDAAGAFWAFIGLCDLHRALGQLSPAVDACETAREIMQRAATLDPGNAGWQRDLSVSNFKIGKSLLDQGQPRDALPYLEADLAIAERLARADPSNAGWQQDAEISRRMVAAVRAALDGTDDRPADSTA